MTIKSDVLKILEQNRNIFISGQELAKQLNVSRMSICKVIKKLKEEGYNIEASTNKGYMLLDNNDILSSEGISCYLDKKMDIYAYKTIDSTNTQMKKFAVDNHVDYALIVAEHQSAGRGRFNRNFYSPEKQGIYMSLLLRYNQTFNDATLITIQSAVAIKRVIKKLCGIDTKIKWVNDLYYQGKKICGILTEAISDFESGMIEAIIIGIGINVSTKQFPEELLDKATSLGIENINRSKFIALIVNEILKIIDEDFNNVLNEYKDASCVLNKKVEFRYKGQIYNGIAKDINNLGNLIVKCDNQEYTLNSGEVSIIQKNYE